MIFNNAEVGALLIAIGQQMIDDDMCFGGALDGDRSDIKSCVSRTLQQGECYAYGVAETVATGITKLSAAEVLKLIEGA